MAKKRKGRSTVAARLSRAKRKLERFESMLRKGEYLTAPERRTFVRLGRLINRLALQQSAKNARRNPGKRQKGGKRVFRSLAELPPGRYVFSKSKGSSRIKVQKFVPRKSRRRRK